MRQTPHREKVSAFLENHWAPVSEVALLLDLDEWDAYRVLTRMEKAGKVRRDKGQRRHLWTAADVEVPRKWSPRQIALEAGHKVYEGSPCPRGHGGIRYATNGCCTMCAAENDRKYQEAA